MDAGERLGHSDRLLILSGGRLLLDPAPPDAERRLTASGMRILAEQDGALVAARG